VILSIVNTAIEYVEKLPAKEEKLTLIATLRAITEGKMFVENERARLTRQLARMKEVREANICFFLLF
jgi:26S proteasome regulatory subunit N5